MNYTIDSYLFDWVDKIRCKEETTCPTWSSFLVQERGLQSPDIKQNEKREIGQKTAAPTKKSSFSSLFLYIRVVYIYTMAVLAGTKLYFIHTHTYTFWLPPPSGCLLLRLSLSLFSTQQQQKKNRKESFLLPKERERERTVVMHEASGRIYDQTRRSLPFNATPTRNEILNFSEFKRSLWGEKKEEKKKTTKEDKKKNFPFHYYGECHWSSCFFFSGDCCVNRPN